MTVSKLRTIIWKPLSQSILLPGSMRWPLKAPLDFLDYSVDLTLLLADIADTLTGVTATTQQLGLGIVNPTYIGNVCTMYLQGGLAGTTYVVDIVASTAGGRIAEIQAEIPVASRVVGVPTSPVTLVAGATWFAGNIHAFLTVPVWAILPTTEITTAAQPFWWNGNVLSVTSRFGVLPTTNAGIALGDLWDNGGTVMCNGNPGLPTSSSVVGTLLYDGGTLVLA